MILSWWIIGHKQVSDDQMVLGPGTLPEDGLGRGRWPDFYRTLEIVMILNGVFSMPTAVRPRCAETGDGVRPVLPFSRDRRTEHDL